MEQWTSWETKFCYSLDGLSTYWFSLDTEVELWLFMLRLGFSGSLTGFTGGIGGTGEGSSSWMLSALVSTGGRDLFGMAPLLVKVSSSSLIDSPLGFLGGWGLGAGVGGIFVDETFWLSSVLWLNWGLRVTEGLAATGGLLVTFLGGSSGFAGSLASAEPAWLSKAWILAWILRWFWLMSPPASLPSVMLSAVFSSCLLYAQNTSSSSLKYLFNVTSSGLNWVTSQSSLSLTKVWTVSSSLIGCILDFVRGSGTGLWLCSKSEDDGVTSAGIFQCTITDLVHVEEESVSLGLFISDFEPFCCSMPTDDDEFVPTFSSVGAALTTGFLTSDFGRDGLGGFCGFLPERTKTET